MEKSPKSRVEIERLVLRELQTSESCEGAIGISIIDCELDSGGLQTGNVWQV